MIRTYNSIFKTGAVLVAVAVFSLLIFETRYSAFLKTNGGLTEQDHGQNLNNFKHEPALRQSIVELENRLSGLAQQPIFPDQFAV